MELGKRFPAPTEGIHHVQPNTELFFDSKCFGKGTLYITESALCWLSSCGRGISLQYTSIIANAISFSEDNIPGPCFFVTCSEEIVVNEDPDELLGAINSLNVNSDDIKKDDDDEDDDDEDEDDDDDDEDDDKENVANEIFFVPNDADKYVGIDDVVIVLSSGLKIRFEHVKTVDERGWTPIHLAAAHGHSEIVKYLAVEGAHLAALDPSSYTALHLAAMNGHKNCLDVLLPMGIDIDSVTAEGFTPLHLAVMK
ncbi:methylosome subunit pICln [Trichonephila clavata]|uniref:Methylosome subunit pICln n=1 Tax=Trichonephila clavata TaxID=2740835 RepID=A0A8X6HQ69_TRICU|nr:methylosome subunit pICln [Trichonephila clavata]